MNKYEAIQLRNSVRTFLKDDLSKDDFSIINEILLTHESMKGPFGHSFEVTLKINNSEDTNNQKIGTYGVLKNVPLYMVGVCDNEIQSIIDFGYIFENIILALTSKGYGTCWLGGTFKRKDFNKDLEGNKIIPAISPIGYMSKKRSLTEKIVRSTASSNNRLDFDNLFLDPSFKTLNRNENTDLIDCLDLVRKGPSASNKQPWRIIVDEEAKIYHFYLERTKNYARFLKYDIQALDIGIALSHFEIGLKHYKIEFTEEYIDNAPEKEGLEYIISLKEK